MSNERLEAFHPLPHGMHWDKRLCRLDPVAAVLLLRGHMLSDEQETDGLLDMGDFWSLAGQALLQPEQVQAAVQAMVKSGLVRPADDDTYELVDFRGLDHAERERRRAEYRRKKRGMESRQSRYQRSPGVSLGDSPDIERRE